MMRIPTRLALLLPALAAATPLTAAERSYSVTDFDRIRVEGGHVVTVVSGKSPSARASGSMRAIDALSVEMQGRTLVIRPNRTSWGGWANETPGAATLRVTVPGLRAATVTGGANLTIDRMKGLRVDLLLGGSGRLAVANLDVDRLEIGLVGAGRIDVGGRASIANVSVRGSGAVDGAALAAKDVSVTSETVGEISMDASHTAKVTTKAAGPVKIAGKAKCTVTALGTGAIACAGGTS